MKTHMISLLALAALGGACLATPALGANIPNPQDVEVTRQNYQRILQVLQDAGLNRKEIKRWFNASLHAPDGPDYGNIPNPKRVEVTRENYKRIVNVLKDAGLDRKQIKRWFAISKNAHASGNTRPHVQARHQVRQIRTTRLNRPVRIRRAVRPARPHR